jgi:hypothetical protein
MGLAATPAILGVAAEAYYFLQEHDSEKEKNLLDS